MDLKSLFHSDKMILKVSLCFELQAISKGKSKCIYLISHPFPAGVKIKSQI